jgi:mannitol-specific phosphotransferase system IIBC component
MEESAEIVSDVSDQGSYLDVEQLEKLKNHLESEENLPLGMIAGVGAALIGAIIWAVVTVVTEYQIGWMAVGLGFLVGYAIRKFGKGVSKKFGIAGAVCAFGGCLVGNLLSICGFLATQESVPLLMVVTNVFLQPAIAVELLQVTFNPMDVIFYAIAVYEGYKFSFRQITQQEWEAVAKI